MMNMETFQPLAWSPQETMVSYYDPSFSSTSSDHFKQELPTSPNLLDVTPMLMPEVYYPYQASAIDNLWSFKYANVQDYVTTTAAAYSDFSSDCSSLSRKSSFTPSTPNEFLPTLAVASVTLNQEYNDQLSSIANHNHNPQSHNQVNHFNHNLHQQQQHHPHHTSMTSYPLTQSSIIPSSVISSSSVTASTKLKRRTHAEPRNHICNLCNKRFTRPSSLKTHRLTHTGEKPFPCMAPDCGKNFSVLSNLRRHYRVHAKRDRKMALKSVHTRLLSTNTISTSGTAPAGSGLLPPTTNITPYMH